MKNTLDYLRSESAAHANVFNLDLDFSTASPEQIAELCTWLRTHPHLNRIDFRSAQRPSTSSGLDLSLLSTAAFCQLFKAIRDNPSIQTIVLPQCSLTQITDAQALESLKDCLIIKKDITIIANRGVPLLGSTALGKTVSLIATGKAEKLKLQAIMSIKTPAPTVIAFLTDLASAKNKAFQYVSLPHNQLNGDVLPQITALANLQITSLDLSENPIALGATLEDWNTFFAAIQNNRALKTLSLKGCELWRAPISLAEEAKSEEQCFALFQDFLLKFVKETHLSSLDLDLNEWEDAFLDKLRAVAQHNPNLYSFKCGHDAEAYDSLATKTGLLGKFRADEKTIRRGSSSTENTSQEDASFEDDLVTSSSPATKRSS